MIPSKFPVVSTIFNVEQYLETLPEGEKQKSEYSLTQHLANNLIDMYINLPSKNHYRRPASYTSKGYRTRRMAVDFAVPLITNVKVAKLLVEALVRKLPLEVSSVDYKTSHTTYTFPGLVNVCAFVPGLVDTSTLDFTEATKASLGAGLTTILIVPHGLHGSIVDESSLHFAHATATGAAHCNYALAVTATSTNVQDLDDEDLQAETKYLFVPLDKSSARVTIDSIAAVAAHFAAWPIDKPIITDAKGSDLASVLLLASLQNRSVHVTDVRGKEDLLLISLSKQKQLKVTCDVAVYSLFFTSEQWSNAPCLPHQVDQDALWKNLDIIDVFSVGDIPYRLAVHLGQSVSPWSGVTETLPLLLSAVSDGRLTLDDIKKRLHDNPARIFALPDQAHTQVEVVVGRNVTIGKQATCWSPLDSTVVTGGVHRVSIHGQTIYLDGATFFTSPIGRDVSGAAVVVLRPPERKASFATAPRQTLTGADHLSPIAMAQSAFMSLSTAQALQATSPSSFLVPIHPAFHRRHILSVKQFSSHDIHDLFNLAHEMRLQVERNAPVDALKGRILCTMFYEPSTRTSSSFDAAMKRCGGEVVQISVDRSSVAKGESLADTVRTLGCYADAIVLRHPDVGSSQTAAKFSPVPIINAGDGIGEHPTQVSS